MNYTDLTGRNFALTTNALKFMQDAYTDFENIVGVLGDNYIVTGCAVTGTSVSDGYMVLKGKLMPFVGGTVGTNVRIKQTVNSVTVGSGVRTETIYYAEFDTYSGNSQTNVSWSAISAPFVDKTTTSVDFGNNGE